MDKILVVSFAVIGIIGMAAAISLLIAFPVMWCWNYAVVAVFGLPKITWGMAWCLLFITNAFFKTSVTQNNKS